MNKISVVLWITKKDIKNKLIELGVKNPSDLEVEKITDAAKNLACAWSSAFLQDLDKNELNNILGDGND